MSPRWRAALIVVLIVLALAAGAAQLYLPPLVEARLEGALAQALQVDSGVEARLTAMPAVRLLWGHVDQVHITAEGAHLDGLRVDKVLIQGNRVRIDAPELRRTGRLAVLDADRLDVSFQVSEDDLDRFVKEYARGMPAEFETELADGSLQLHGELAFFGRTFPLTVEGSLELVSSTRIDFVPSRIVVDTMQVPQFVLEGAMQVDELRVGLDVARFPVPLEVSSVVLQPGWLTVEARSPLARAGSGR